MSEETNPKTARPLLVVDDDENNRDMLSRRLRKAGYEVEVADSAASAVDIMQHTPVELVLLDNMMPGMSGVDLLRKLRMTRSASDLPVIMVTAMNESKDIVEALNVGANDYVTKPVDMAVALARIETQVRRKKAEEELASSEQRLALAFRGTRDGMWDWDLRRNEIFYSERWKTMLGLRESDVTSSPEEWFSRVHPDDLRDLRRTLSEHRKSQSAAEFSSEHRLRHADGAYQWVLCRAAVLRSPDGVAIRMAGCVTDVNRAKASDPLTGLPNRLALHAHLQDLLDAYRKGTRASFAVCFVDLDRFKVVNDSMGHEAGDQLLIEVAHRLESAVRTGKRGISARPKDAIARLGGDEFAVVVENIDSTEQARLLGNRLIREIATGSRMVLGRELFTTASVGVVVADKEYTTAHQIIRDADTAMYHAKGRGKNRCEIFDSAMHEDARLRLEIANDLQRALSRGEFEVWYQPKVDVALQRLVGFEALLRWNRPGRSPVSPSHFIPIAEESGLIVPIGMWVLEKACQATHQWHRQYPTEPPLGISVNLSVRQLRQPDLVDSVAAILQRTGLLPSSLQLEVTESILIEDPESAVRTLNRIKELGVGLKIDDFGTGYSSLRQLADMPFDSLKIDRSFIENLCETGPGENMVRTIINLARNLGIEVIAEGVETASQFEKLAQLGCDHVQGYYFSAAVGPREVEKLLGASLKKILPASNRQTPAES